jgi:hypothetical protein
VIALLSAGLATAQLGVPRIGCFVDGQHQLRTVSGIAANFLLGDPESGEIISAACSERLTLIKRENLLEVRIRNESVEWSAPPGPALFGFSRDGLAALAYFPETKEWFRVDRFAMAQLPPIEGEVLAVGNPEMPSAVVRRDGALWIAGANLRPAPADATEPLLLLPDGSLLYARGGDLVLAAVDGSERCFTLPVAAQALEWLGRDWVRISLRGGSGRLALALGDRNALYRLPEVAP